MFTLEHSVLDPSNCKHPEPACLLRVMGDCLFCGHCGADLPDYLAYAHIMCTGEFVLVTQKDFGKIHQCGADLWAEQEQAIWNVADLRAGEPAQV